jgi:hypothetical protein
MKNLNLTLVVVLSLMIFGEAFSAPFLERLYNGYPGVFRQVQTTRRQTTRTEKPRGRSYKDICRAINPAPYAFPNKIPYPSVPIC